MASQAKAREVRHTAESYLAFERAAETKHEFISGEIVAMAGAMREHNLLTGNTARRLGNQLEGKTCETYSNDMRVHTTMKNYVYPDVVVVCGKPHFADKVLDTLLNPVVVVEVLSHSSEARDRGEKFFNYRAIGSVQNILFISQREMRVEHYVRQPDSTWRLFDLSAADEWVNLASIGCALILAEIYERVEFQPEGEEDAPQSEEPEAGRDSS